MYSPLAQPPLIPAHVDQPYPSDSPPPPPRTYTEDERTSYGAGVPLPPINERQAQAAAAEPFLYTTLDPHGRAGQAAARPGAPPPERRSPNPMARGILGIDAKVRGGGGGGGGGGSGGSGGGGGGRARDR
jgi:hypothetical protein